MIRKGEPWGSPIDLTGREPVANDDAELARLLADRPGPSTVVVLRGGDLHHSLGGRRGGAVVETSTALPVDLVEVTFGGETHLAVAHVVARRRGWSGEFAVAMNGTHLGPWNLGPKAHPNDGLVDVTRGRLDLGDRLKARRRAVTGTHVPHPSLTTSRVGRAEWRFDRPVPIRVDGREVGHADLVHIEVRPDCGSVVVA